MSEAERVPTDIEQHAFDLIVIGAGINGAGIARDAAMRGLDVLLVDKHDIGSGTTPWSTRLIHGGLRYLEHGELRLVHESLRERSTLLRIAPHLVRPLPFLLPVYRWHRRDLRTIQAGMIAYDLLSIGKHLPRHRILSAERTLRAAPSLSPIDLRGSAFYWDGQVTFPERLALENVIDAVRHGATVLTYARVTNVVVTRGIATGLEIESVDSGERFRVTGKAIVNAAGPWVDRLLGAITDEPLIGGTLGSHVIVDRFDGAPNAAVYSEAKTDGRPFFVVPWLGRLLIGTTDIPFSGDPDTIRPTSAEVDYLLAQTNAIFPMITLKRDDVLFGYTGVRPLPVAHGRSAGAVTRRHMIRHHAPRADGLYSIVGGKLTTYRSLAEQVTDRICRRLGHRDPGRTADRALPGAGSAVARERFRSAGVSESAIERMVSIYGSRTTMIATIVEDNPSLANEIGLDTSAIAAEIVFAFQDEHALTMADVLLRRTMLALTSPCEPSLIDSALEIARKHLNWNQQRIELERVRFDLETWRLRVSTDVHDDQDRQPTSYNLRHEH